MVEKKKSGFVIPPCVALGPSVGVEDLVTSYVVKGNYSHRGPENFWAVPGLLHLWALGFWGMNNKEN